MYLKRTPHLESEAIRLRSEGRSYQEIADILTKSGHPVSKATVHGWFRDGLGTKPASWAGQPAPSTPPAETPPAPPGALRSASEPADGLEVDPDELRAVVTEQIRRGRAAVREAERGDRPADARAAERTLSVWVKLLQQIQAKSAADGDAVRVRAADIEAASQRALEGLGRTLEAVLGDVATWPRCPHCGEARGAFGDGEVSTVRALFERAARRGG